MPEIVKSSWADEVELDSGALPPPTEVVENGLKIVTEYKFNKDDKKVKVVRTYRITKQVVSKSIAQRKIWKKFGDSASDKVSSFYSFKFGPIYNVKICFQPGPNTHTTMVSEDVYMQFISSKEEEKAVEVDPAKSMAKCRICNGDHWSVNCPFKGTQYEKLSEPAKPQTSSAMESSGTKSGKYVPPFMKDQKGGMGMGIRNKDDTTAIRISNLSESMVESDLEELVKKIGPYSKIYLARDKNTGLCKGFAYVHFKSRKDAATAIECLNGHGYDHLILNVEWSKPQNPN